MTRTHKILDAYLRLALGLPIRYTEEMANEDVEKIFDNKEPSHIDRVWNDHPLVDEICAAKGITRERFIKSMAAPKPGLIAHLIYCDEIKQVFGETDLLPKHWPPMRGLIIPKRENGEIVKLEFHRLTELLKPRARVSTR